MNHSMGFGTYEDLSQLIPNQFFAKSGIIKKLSGKKIADIGSSFSDLVLDLQQRTKNSTFTIIDPIFVDEEKFNEAYLLSRNFMQDNLDLLHRKMIMFNLFNEGGPSEEISDDERYLLNHFDMSRGELRKAFGEVNMDKAMEGTQEGDKFYVDRLSKLDKFDSLQSFKALRQGIKLSGSQDSFSGNSFDVVFMTNLLCNVDSPLSFLQKTESLLIRKGYIIVTDYLNIGSLRFLKLAAEAKIIKKIGQNDKLVSYKINKGEVKKITDDIMKGVFQD